MASPIAIIPSLCIALGGTCPAANKQQGHSCGCKAEIIPKATPLLSPSSPAGSTGSCGAVPLPWQVRRWERDHGQQCSLWCTNPPRPNNPARWPPAALRGLSKEKHPPFSFPCTAFSNQHTTGNITMPCRTIEEHQNLSISAFTWDRKGHCTGTEEKQGVLYAICCTLISQRTNTAADGEKFLFVLTSVQESIVCNTMSV